MKNLIVDKTNKSDVEYYRIKQKRFSKNKDNLYNHYGKFSINSNPDFKEKYKCWVCNKEIIYYDEPNERVFCDDCRKKHQSEISKLQKQQTEIKSKLMLEKAMCVIEESKSYAHEFYDTYKLLLKDIESNPTKYRSSEEIVTAMVLYNYNYEFEVNKKICQYYVDFYIPECKICLEVDGERHKYKSVYDKNRDIDIRNNLGAEWEIVRIPTKYIVEYPDKIVDAMEEIKQAMINERKKNSIISDNFSIREQNYYSKILNPKKEKQDDRYKQIKEFFEKKKKS